MKPTVPAVKPLIDWYYAQAGNGAGGSLHVVLDDGNVADSHVIFCIEWAKREGDKAGEIIGELLLLMSSTQRLKLGVRS